MKKLLIGFLSLILILNCMASISFAAAVVLITATPPEGIYGNNFYKDNPPKFMVNIKNASLIESFSGEVFYNITKTDGSEVFGTEKVKDISIMPGKNTSFELVVEKEYFGRLNLNMKVVAGDKIIVKTIPYTMSNNEASNPSNKKFGIAAHLGARGDVDLAFPLLKGAGIGTLRNELFSWSEVEKEKGKLIFTEEMDRKLDLLDEYDLSYIHLWAGGNYSVYPDQNLVNNPEWQYLFPTSTEGLTALSNYMEELVKFADGRIDVIEVWNEYNNMSGPYKWQYQYMVDYHKAVYDGVKRAEKSGAKDVVVSGIDTDSWGVFKSGELEGFLNLANGKKIFDAVSLHPYNNLDDFNTNPPETGVTKTIVEKTKERLKEYGQSSDKKFYFTESGWSDNLFDYNNRELQAAYNIRHQTKIVTEGLVETSCLYTLFDYGQFDGNEGHFGIIENYDRAYAEVPYLGKESYPAIAYYNNLMAEATFVEMINTENDDNVLIYHFIDRLGRDVLMLNTINNEEINITLDLGTDTCVISDMYGNEETETMPTGKINTTVSGIPKYIICDNLDSTPDSSVTIDIYGIVSGKTESRTNIVMNMYNDGFTPDNTTSENVSEAFYYTEQKKTDENGEFTFSFPLDDDFKSKNAYIYIDGEEIPRIYKIESWGDFALSYEAFPDVSEINHEFFAYLSGKKQEIDNIELICAGYSGTEQLMDVNIAQEQSKDEEVFIKKVELDLDLPKSKLMIVSDFYTLKPMVPCINLR